MIMIRIIREGQVTHWLVGFSRSQSGARLTLSFDSGCGARPCVAGLKPNKKGVMHALKFMDLEQENLRCRLSHFENKI
jgi:hypothetical protein